MFGDSSLHSAVRVLILHLYFNFNLNNFLNAIHQLTVIKANLYARMLPFTHIRYGAFLYNIVAPC